MSERTYMVFYPDDNGVTRRVTLAQLQQLYIWKQFDPEMCRRTLAMVNRCMDDGHDVGWGETIRSYDGARAGFWFQHYVVDAIEESDHCIGGSQLYPDENGVLRYWAAKPHTIHHQVPENSWHCQESPTLLLSLATDMVGDVYYAQTIAPLYGLRPFPHSDDPHFQAWDVAPFRGGWVAPLGWTLPVWNLPPGSTPDPEEDDDMNRSFGATFTPNAAVAATKKLDPARPGADGQPSMQPRNKTFAETPDGRVRWISGPEGAYAQASGAADFPITGTEHYDQLDGWSQKFTF